MRRMLLVLARSRWAGRLMGWLFVHVSFLLPVNRLHETKTLLAFHHPSPSYPLHVLIVPKREIANLLALQPADADFLADLFQTVQQLVAQFDLEATGYRLIANGGAYQDVPHLHFHLIAD